MIRKIGIISRTYRHINRYSEIIAVLFKHGFGDLVASTKLDKYIDFGRKFFPGDEGKPMPAISRWERIRLAVEELGPTFIKFGQIMSNRPDLLPHELVKEFEKLQDSVPPFDSDIARSIVESELGCKIDDVFDAFESKPLASASIAQVHKAVLKNGEDVVLKVQRPGIRDTIDVDLEIMLHLAQLAAEHVEGMDLIDPVGILSEFERTIRKEVDFLIEAKHIERFDRNFRGNKYIIVPKVYGDYSSKRVLVLEYINACKISSIEKLKQRDCDPKVLAERTINATLKQIFEHGFFHADPHPGNLCAVRDNVLCFFDFGMMGYVYPRYRAFLGDLMLGTVKRDSQMITKALMRFSNAESENVYEDLDGRVREILDEYMDVPLEKIELGALLERVLSAVLECRISIPPNIYLLSKAMMTAEGVCRMLWPECNVVEYVKPYAVGLAKERMDPRRMAKDMFGSASDFAMLLKDLPLEMKQIIDQIKKGKVSIVFQHKGLENMLHKHDQISNRIAFAIVLASLIIGSSLIVHSNIPPVWNGVPVVGILGFLGAGFMGFWLLISMLRHGKM